MNKNFSFKPVVLDVEGLTLNNDDIKRINHHLTGGVILFARNFNSRLQLQNLCHEIKKHAPELIIFIDHEGGRVQRCKTDGFTHLPAMRKLGELYAKNPWQGLISAQACGYILASELRACGVDFSFTPVLDIDYQNSSVIGDRAFEKDANLIGILAGKLIEGLHMAGMPSCGKHFPGHGFVTADSHVDIPIDNRDFDTIWNADIVPYMLLIDKLDSIMPAHVIYNQIDDNPAGFSKFWLQEILRTKLGFNGIIFSDDLAMQGASVVGNVIDRAYAALNAGCDMILICNQPNMADDLLSKLEYREELARASYIRKNKILPKEEGKGAKNWDNLQQDSYYIYAKELLQEFNLIYPT